MSEFDKSLVQGNNIFLINVGFNSSHRALLNFGLRFPPIFKNNSFVFIPIPESFEVGSDGTTYSELGLDLWLKDSSLYAHNDPEFIYMSYGDYIDKPNKGKLRDARSNDVLLFFSSFQRFNQKIKKAESEFGFFFIGYFILEYVISSEDLLEKSESDFTEVESIIIKHNAHFRREYDEMFFVWKGSSNSKLFSKAIPFNKSVAKKILRTSMGKEIDFNKTNKNGKNISEFSIINSQTRAIQKIPAERAKLLWEYIEENSL